MKVYTQYQESDDWILGTHTKNQVPNLTMVHIDCVNKHTMYSIRKQTKNSDNLLIFLQGFQPVEWVSH